MNLVSAENAADIHICPMIIPTDVNVARYAENSDASVLNTEMKSANDAIDFLAHVMYCTLINEYLAQPKTRLSDRVFYLILYFTFF